MLLRHDRILQRVVLVVILDNRARQPGALGDAQSLRQAASGDVADHDLQRDDFHLANELLAHVQPADEMRRHADFGQPQHEVLADPIVQHALAGDRAFLLGVERGGVVLEILDERTGFGTLEQDLGLALIELPAACHQTILFLSPRGDQPDIAVTSGRREAIAVRISVRPTQP